MATTNTLIEYKNGDTFVTILRDGTKIRQYEREPHPLLPESIDLKITDFCDAGCEYCHESSTVSGQHANLGQILDALEGVSTGTELAIGGGDPLSNPAFERLLVAMATRNVICNVTVNGKHLRRYDCTLRRLQELGLIHGLGISYWEGMRFPGALDPQDAILHFIAGVHEPRLAIDALKTHGKILVLGYKRYGRGLKVFDRNVELCLSAWRYWLPVLIRANSYAALCFDNLALEQLRVKELVPAFWDDLFMGDDGHFSMYVDAVRNEFAKSSTSERIPREGRNIQQMFEEVKRRG